MLWPSLPCTCVCTSEEASAFPCAFFCSHTCKQDGSKGTAQAEELHVKSADSDEARTIKEAKDDLEDEESEEDF